MEKQWPGSGGWIRRRGWINVLGYLELGTRTVVVVAIMAGNLVDKL